MSLALISFFFRIRALPVKEIVTTGDSSVATTRADITFPIAILPTTIDTIHIPIGIAATLTGAGSALVSFLINRNTRGRNRRHFMPVSTSMHPRVAFLANLGTRCPLLPSRPAVRISWPWSEQPCDEESKRRELLFSDSRPTISRLPDGLKKIAKLSRGGDRSRRGGRWGRSP